MNRLSLGTATLELGVNDAPLRAGMEKSKGETTSSLSAMKTAAVAAGAGIAAGLGFAIKGAGDLQQSVANISTIKPDIDTKAVFNSLNEMQRTVPQSAAELGDALYNVFSSIDLKPIVDKNGKVVQTATEQGLKLVQNFAEGAVGAGTDTATFGTAVMGVMNAYKLTVDDAAHVSDVFFNVVNAGVVSGQELAGSLGVVTGSAKSAGLSVEELGGFIVGITKEGGTAQNNMQHLNSLFVKMANPDVLAGFKELGIAVTDANGNFLPMTDRLEKLKAKLADMSQSKQADVLKNLFGDETSSAAAVTIMSELDAVKGAIKTNKEEAGAAHKAFEKMNATFNSQFGILKNTLASIGIEIGGRLLPYITPIVTWIAHTLPKGMDFLTATFTNLKDKAMPVFSLLSNHIQHSLTPVMVVFGKMREIAMDAWQHILAIFHEAAPQIKKLIGPATVAFGLLMDNGIIGAMRKVYAALVLFGPRIMQSLTWVRHHLPQIFDGLNTAATTVQTVMTNVQDTITQALAFMVEKSKPFIDEFKKDITDAHGPMQAIIDAAMGIYATFQKAWPGIQRAVVQAVDYIIPKALAMHREIMKFVTEVAPKVQKAVTTMVNWITEHWDTISSVTKAVFDGLNAIIGTALAIVKTTVKVWLDIFNGDWDKVWEDVKQGFMEIWNSLSPFLADVLNGIVNVFVGGINKIIGKLNEMIRAFNTVTGFKMPEVGYVGGSTGGSGSGSGWSQGGPGGHASGGKWSGGSWSWLGEKGPELGYTGQDMHVFNHQDSMAIAARAMSPFNSSPETITLYSPIILDGKVLAEINRKFDRRYQARN